MSDGIRRYSCFIIMFILLLGAGGCGRSPAQEADFGKSVLGVYYIDLDEVHLVKELLEIQDQADPQETVELLRAAIEKQPENATLKSPINGFRFLSLQAAEGQINVDVDSGYYDLPMASQALVRAAIVKTFSQAFEDARVLMTVSGTQLMDSKGVPVGAMTVDSFVEHALDAAEPSQTRQVVLYFGSEDGEGLVKVVREIPYGGAASMERMVLDNLLAGPLPEEISTWKVQAVADPGTQVISTTVRDEICYINLDEAFLNPITEIKPEITIYAIADTLSELGGIDTIQIAVEGRTGIMFRRTMDLGSIYQRKAELLRPENTVGLTDRSGE